MSKSSAEYWKERSEQRLISAEQKILRYEAEMKKQFEKVYQNIEAEIAKLYFRYASDEGMKYEDALKYLSDNGRKEFQKTLEYYIEKSKDAEFMKKIKQQFQSLGTRTDIQRLEALKANIEYEVANLYNEIYAGTQVTFDDVLQHGYYHTIFDIQQFQGFGVSFARISPHLLSALLEYPWSGKNYSQKIWGHVDGFSDKLESILTAGLIQGKSNQHMAEELKSAAESEYKNAIRLVRTETNYIAGEATHKAYQEYEVEKYQFLATLDIRTSEICAELDGKVFLESERKVGVNCHPMHPHCRSTDIPDIPDLEGTRIARKADGSTYKVDRNMTYNEWYSKYVETDSTELAAQKANKNKSSDKKQYEKYKELLGKNAPKTFEKFQDIKYNDNDEWDKLKKVYKSKSPVNIGKIDYSDKELVKAKILEYGKKIKNEAVENAYVIQSDGKVKRITGDKDMVNPQVLGDKLKNSTLIHNHPADVTEYSFSKDDLELMIKHEIKELYGIDEKYMYRFINDGCTYEEFDKHYMDAVRDALAKTPIERAQEDRLHNINEELAKRIKINYERNEL